MGASSLFAVAADTWCAIAVAVVLLLRVAGPSLAASLYAVCKRSGVNVDAVADVARFIELSEQAQSGLAATRSIDRFIELLDEAREELAA